MAVINPTDRTQIISPLNNGDVFILGNTSNEADVGGWMITLMPDAGGFTGAIAILCRPEGKGAYDNAVGFMPCPYRRIVVNGLASDYQVDSVSLTGATVIQVPANGLSIAFAVVCSAGSAEVYSRPLQGSTAI